MKRKKTKYYEAGVNGINYAMYVIAIIMTLVIFRFLTFQMGLYVVQQHLQDSLHIAGSAGLAYNYGDSSLYEMDLDRLYVVDLAKGSTSKNWNLGEKEQALALGKWITSQYVNKMELKGELIDSPKIYPTDSMMISMCGEDTQVYLSHLDIYQPLYERIITPQLDNQQTPFLITYTYSGVVKYTYKIQNNEVTDVEKDWALKTDRIFKLQDGSGAEVDGTTIDMCTQTVLYGVNNIFAGVSTTTPTWGDTIKKYYDDGTGHYTEIEYRELDTTSNTGGFFSEHPVKKRYGIEVWEAVDIVPAATDTRAVS